MALVFDSIKNFAYSVVATAPSPATSGTSLTVAAGDGTKFPTPPFDAVVWPSGVQPSVSNAEVVRVTNISTDTLTITRTQEGSNTRSIVVNDQIAQNITTKYITDIENAFQTVSAEINPIGSITMWATGTPPTGWLLLNGQAVSRTTYSVLFGLWSTTFGTGDGSTTFNLPNMVGQIPIGMSASTTGINTLGATTGSFNHAHGSGTLTVASHTHGFGTLTVASHQHGPGDLQVAAHTHGPGTLTVASHTHGSGTLGTVGTSVDHTHTIPNHSHTGTTDNANLTDLYGSGSAATATPQHTHTFTTDVSGGGGTTSNSTSTVHTHDVINSTDAQSPAVNSGLSASTAPSVTSGVTDLTAPAVNSGATDVASPAVSSGSTGTANPPVLALNFIVRALSAV